MHLENVLVEIVKMAGGGIFILIPGNMKGNGRIIKNTGKGR